MYFKTEILCKHLSAKPTLSARAICLTQLPDQCTNMLYFNMLHCMHPQSLAPNFKVYTCVKNNHYISIGIHLVMQIRITLIPLITYTPPNDLATHNNANLQSLKHVY